MLTGSWHPAGGMQRIHTLETTVVTAEEEEQVIPQKRYRAEEPYWTVILVTGDLALPATNQ